MSGEWREVSLQEVTQLIARGITPAYSDASGIPVLNQKCIRDYRVEYQLARITDPTSRKIPSDKILRDGDILINSTGQGTLGRVAQVFGLTTQCTADSHVTIVRPIESAVDIGFLGWHLKGRQSEIESLAEGSTGQTELSRYKLADLIIPLPPLPEQRRIAKILGDLDDKIELNRKMNETLEHMARALFKSWFIDFDPVRAKMEGRMPEGMDADTAALFPSRLVESELGLVPEGWSAKPLPDVIEVNPRRTLKSGTVAPYLDMKNLPTQGHSAEEVVDRRFASGTKFQNGDTLLARITPCLENGKTGFVDFLKDGEVGWGSTEYIVFAPKPPLPPQFGYLLARSDALRAHAIQNMTGTSGRQRVPTECFSTFWLAVPPTDIDERFDELTAPLMAQIKSNIHQSRTLASLRDTLLPKLMRGEVQIPNEK